MDKDWLPLNPDPAHTARERNKARELRRTGWWQALLQRGECHYCHKHFPPEALTMDHVIPVARGGTSTRGNIVPACAACNRTKRHLTPVEQTLRALEDEGALPELSPDELFDTLMEIKEERGKRKEKKKPRPEPTDSAP